LGTLWQVNPPRWWLYRNKKINISNGYRFRRLAWARDARIGAPLADRAVVTTLSMPPISFFRKKGVGTLNRSFQERSIMNIDLRCFSTLSNTGDCSYDQAITLSPSGDVVTVRMLADQARVPEEAISLVFVNGRRSDFDQRLSDGDRVAFAPAVGGM
jgi:hypothetical protein